MKWIYVSYELEGGDGDGRFPVEEAVELMTDEWIKQGNCSYSTIMDLRDALKEALKKIYELENK